MSSISSLSCLSMRSFVGTMIHGDVATAIFFGFSAALLGVTGFEISSKNSNQVCLRKHCAICGRFRPFLTLYLRS